MHLVHFEVYLEELIDQIEHPPPLGHVLGGPGVCGADPEAGHDALTGLLQRLPRLAPALSSLLLVGLHGEQSEVETDDVHDRQQPVLILQ